MEKSRIPDLSQPELPAPDEKLLRAPTFFEKYHFLKSVLIVAAIILVVDVIIFTLLQTNNPPSQMTNVSPTPQATKTTPTTNWISYLNGEGNFMFQYPPGAYITENVTAEPKSVTLVSPENNKVKLTIHYEAVDPSQTLPALIEQNKLCPEIASDQGQPSIINGEQKAQLYMDTKCGEFTKTIIYTQNGPMLYTISIDTPAKYEDVKLFTDQIISTLKFGDASSAPPPALSPVPSQIFQACTMEAKMCPDGSSVGRTGPNCEFTPCPKL